MPTPPAVYAALSVHSFVTKVGDYAGFLAIIGVALLVILYFVHARETANLRDRAEDAEDRMAHLEYQLEQVSRTATAAHQTAQAARTTVPAQPVAAPPVGRPANVPVAAPAMAPTAAAPATAAPAMATRAVSPPAPRTIPEAPFGTAAPALSAATRMIPAAVEPDVVSAAPQPAPVQASPAPVTALAAGPAPTTPEPTSPPPATVAAGGVSEPPPPRTPTAPRRDYGRDSGSRSVRGWLAAGAIVVVIIIVAAVLVIHHHNSSSSSSRSQAAAATHSKKKKGSSSTTATKRIDPTNVTVAVLNGTTTNNLAADVSQKLSQDGFKPGMTANAADQQEATTTIGYLPGERARALAVAKALDLNANAVHPVTASNRQVACSSTPTACPAQVVVDVGADLASIA